MKKVNTQSGLSLIELIISVALSVIILGAGISAFSTALRMRSREASKTDAITSTQAALNVLTREIGNSGFGLSTNGIVLADSTNKKLRFRANLFNDDGQTAASGEDVMFYFDSGSGSVVRYDRNSNSTAGVVNRISDVDFGYYDYTSAGRTGPNTAPTADTGRVVITLTVFLPDVSGQPANQTVTVTSDVTLRNSPYMRGQY